VFDRYYQSAYLSAYIHAPEPGNKSGAQSRRIIAGIADFSFEKEIDRV